MGLAVTIRLELLPGLGGDGFVGIVTGLGGDESVGIVNGAWR